jgi:hypothetical protein
MSKTKKNYHQIKEEERKYTEKFSERKLKLYLKAHKFLISLYSDYFMWTVSFISFFAFPIKTGQLNLLLLLFIHFLMWEFILKKLCRKWQNEDTDEILIAIEVIEEIISERAKSRRELI